MLPVTDYFIFWRQENFICLLHHSVDVMYKEFAYLFILGLNFDGYIFQILSPHLYVK